MESKNEKNKFGVIINGIGFASLGAILTLLLMIYWGPNATQYMPMFGLNRDQMMQNMGMDQNRGEYLEMKEYIQEEQRDQGEYRCCLESSCTYCIEKDPEHGEGAACECLADVVNGKHPCGECMGEILEGHGNRFLAKYFAQAIADEVGEQHIDTLRQIISEKYNASIDELL